MYLSPSRTPNAGGGRRDTLRLLDSLVADGPLIAAGHAAPEAPGASGMSTPVTQPSGRAHR